MMRTPLARTGHVIFRAHRWHVEAERGTPTGSVPSWLLPVVSRSLSGGDGGGGDRAGYVSSEAREGRVADGPRKAGFQETLRTANVHLFSCRPGECVVLLLRRAEPKKRGSRVHKAGTPERHARHTRATPTHNDNFPGRQTSPSMSKVQSMMVPAWRRRPSVGRWQNKFDLPEPFAVHVIQGPVYTNTTRWKVKWSSTMPELLISFAFLRHALTGCTRR